MLSSNSDYIFKEKGKGKHCLAGMGTVLTRYLIITHFRKNSYVSLSVTDWGVAYPRPTGFELSILDYFDQQK